MAGCLQTLDTIDPRKLHSYKLMSSIACIASSLALGHAYAVHCCSVQIRSHEFSFLFTDTTVAGKLMCANDSDTKTIRYTNPGVLAKQRCTLVHPRSKSRYTVQSRHGATCL